MPESKQDYVVLFLRNITALRKQHSLTKSEMANRLGISVYTYRTIEKGILPPRLSSDIIFQIWLEFHISPKEQFHPIFDTEDSLSERA